MSTVHVRYSGNSQDIDFDDMFAQDRLASIGITDANPGRLSSDNVKNAVANFLDVSLAEFNDYEVEFNKNGNITVRPSAVFG